MLFSVFLSFSAFANDCGFLKDGKKVVIDDKEYDVNKTSNLYLESPGKNISLKDYLPLECVRSISIFSRDVNLDGIGGFSDLQSLNVGLTEPKEFPLTLGEIRKINDLKGFSINISSEETISFDKFPDVDALYFVGLNTGNMDFSLFNKLGYINELSLPSEGVDYSRIPDSVEVKMLTLSSFNSNYKGGDISEAERIATNGNIFYVFIDDSGFTFDRLKSNGSIEKLLVHDKHEPPRDIILSMTGLQEYGTTSVYGYGGEKWYKDDEIVKYFGQKTALARSTSVKGYVTSWDAGAGYINEKNQLVYADKLTLSQPNKCGSNNVYISTRLLDLDIEEYKKIVYTLIDTRAKVQPMYEISACSTSGALISGISLQ